jgi:signal transduction histidine kinase
VANFEGLLYYDRSRWRIINTPDMTRVTEVYRASDNTIWVGGYNYFARLRRKDNGELLMQQAGEPNLFKGEVMEIFEIDGSLQFLVSDNYIYEVKNISDSDTPVVTQKKRANTDLHMGAKSDIVSLEKLFADEKDVVLDDITQTEELDGGLRVKVSKSKGLIITDHDDRELYTISEANGLCSNQVAYVAYDGHGMLWGATSHGVFAIEMPSVYSYILAKDGLAGEVYAITAFDGGFYVGGTNGLYRISSRQCQRIEAVSNICWTLCERSDGLLAATSSGIYRIAHGGSVSRLTSNATTAMLVDGDKVYAAEPDGVYCYQAGTVKMVDDLPLVTEIRQDALGGLWFQNVHGQTKGKAPERKREPVDDLPAYLLKPISDIEIKAQFRQGDLVWIGGDEVLAIVDTGKKELAALSDSRTVRFRSVIMGSDSVLWGGFGDMPKKLPKLDSNEGHLHFYYALKHAPLSGKTLYRYRLSNSTYLGADDQWSAWSEKSDVEFLNLPHGSFTLSVQAQLANGELSEVASVDFSIAFPLLMRWYMVVFYLIVIAWLLYLLFRYRLKRLQRDKMKLERIVEERTSDLRNAQHELIRQEKMATVGKLTEGLIDRILNPMNYIINFSKMSNDLLKDLKEDIDHNKDKVDEDDYEDMVDLLGMLTENLQNVDQYGQNTTRTLKAMEEMLKDRTGGYVDMDLLPVLQQNEEMLSKYYATEKEQHHIRFTFSLPPADPQGGFAMPLHGNPDMLSKTIMSLLGNAVYAVIKKQQKAQPDAAAEEYIPEISLTATQSDAGAAGGSYVLKIRDNGTGIGEKTIGKIFDPFFTTKTTAEAAGVGLYLSREIIQNHGGDISVESVKDEYTEFTITLPAAIKVKSEE